MPAGLTVYEIIAITGHRVYDDPGAFYRGLDNLRAQRYFFGGARGADTDALRYIARTQPTATRTVVVPNRVIHQPVVARDAINRYADEVIELRQRGPGRYQYRNRYMVDRANHTRAFYDGRGRGGTYNTIEYCKSSNKSYDVWSVDKIDQEAIMQKDKAAFDKWIQDNKNMRTNPQSSKGFAVAYIKEKLQMGMEDYLISIGVTYAKTYEDYFHA